MNLRQQEQRRLRDLLLAASTVLIGCVGTDIVGDSTVTMPARIEITPRTAAVQVGAETTFQATYFDSLGNERSALFLWQSLHPDVAMIDQTGLATGIMPGQAMVVASAQGVSSQPALLTVVADPNQI
ncbi:Ig-like domain-containing protein, partial [bacterium]|nr:Ig-like domain-containing protein [bacterium]